MLNFSSQSLGLQNTLPQCVGHWLVITCFWCCLSEAAPQKIVVPAWGTSSSQQNTYIANLLNLAFQKTEAQYGLVELVTNSEILSLARVMVVLKDNTGIDVVWTGVNKQREQDFLPIYVPLLREFNKYRVLLIRKEDQERFSQIKSLDDLRVFSAGACPDWPSTNVLIANELRVVLVKNSDLLFPMLKAKRFDYISRNVYEVWGEEVELNNRGLAVEKTLLLHDGVQLYFFVNKKNKMLAERIEKGLGLAMADGSFERLFGESFGFSHAEAAIKSGERRLLELQTDVLQ